MARIKLSLPQNFSFSTQIPVRITDINYGNHLGNDAVLGLLHEARMQFLKKAGYSELDLAGVGLIMADVAIEFKAEAFYGDILTAYVAAGDFSKIGFDLYYKLVKKDEEKIVAVAKTGMICFDYEMRKVAAVPDAVRQRLDSDKL
ncbi:MAG TPA: thioesterase family protein [Flavisolibacter sp.]|jgi:acyl-CoA thioesterase FadM|nr:thioesterase family protein [Flavisolibacter sp.]